LIHSLSGIVDTVNDSLAADSFSILNASQHKNQLAATKMNCDNTSISREIVFDCLNKRANIADQQKSFFEAHG